MPTKKQIVVLLAAVRLPRLALTLKKGSSGVVERTPNKRRVVVKFKPKSATGDITFVTLAITRWRVRARKES